jgi:hypothetical protein
VAPTCEAQGGKRVTLTSAKLPWPATVFENAKREFREKLGFREQRLINPREELVIFAYNCEGVRTTEVAGEQFPLILNNGISIGAGPVELQFEPEKVNPESHNLTTEVVGPVEVEGRIKMVGYGAEELIEVKNP